MVSMRYSSFRVVLFGVLGSCGVGCLVAEPAAQKHKNPKQPWSQYTVHDTDRPHPPKVRTAGAVNFKAPSDATVLFDGKDTDAFTGKWKVADGVLIASPGDLKTVKPFGSCQLHIEWKIPAGRKVNGQAGGNSGVFLMDRYEVQVLESHSNVTYADGQAAAIYGQYPPLVNASAPQGEWQSYDIIFHAPVYGEKGMESPATVTVFHNGVLVHSNRALHGPVAHRTVAKYPKTHPKKAPLRLQWHGDPIEFRNIWIREID